MYPDYVQGRRASVSAERSRCCLVLRVAGEIDPVSAVELEEAALEGIRDGARHLQVDLSAVEFMDSSGLRALITLGQHLGSLRQVCLVSPTRLVIRLLEVSHLLDEFPRFPTLEEAEAHGHDGGSGAGAPRDLPEG